MSFCEDIERESEAQRDAMAFHPFVQGIGDGTLPLDRFKHFITQDYVYLIDFARCLALAAAKAPDLPAMSWFARAVDYILNTEMDLHRSYCAQFGITEAELDATRHAPTCYSYTSYLLRVAHQGSFGELVAARPPLHLGLLAGRRTPGRSGAARSSRLCPVDRNVRRSGAAIRRRGMPRHLRPRRRHRRPRRNRRHEGSLHHLHPLRAGFLGNGLDP